MNDAGAGLAVLGTLAALSVTGGFAYFMFRLIRGQGAWVRQVWEQAGQRVNGHYGDHKLEGELEGVSYSCSTRSIKSVPRLIVKIPSASPGTFSFHLRCTAKAVQSGQTFWDMCQLNADDLALTDRFCEGLQLRLCALGEVELCIKEGRLIFEVPHPGLDGTYKLHNPELIVQVITAAVEVARAVDGEAAQGACR